jgi:radical SAM superfamily enzyme YgiQ (UPF0313 family)
MGLLDSKKRSKNKKILFISSASVGPLYLSHILKKNGFTVMRLHQGYKECLGEPSQPFSPPVTEAELRKFCPDIVGFSVDTASFSKAEQMAAEIKKVLPNVLIVFGGPHPSISPDDSINSNCVDAICYGEGELAMLELCECIEKGMSPAKIENIWIKLDGKVYKNPRRPYIQELDSFPMDRGGLHYGGVITGRGCLGNCAFCGTPAMKKNGPRGKYFRKHSVEYVLDEIAVVYKGLIKYSLHPKSIAGKLLGMRDEKGWIYPLRFKDDTFLGSKKWFLEFAPKYKKRFPRLKYICQARANEIDEEVASWLKKSGCVRVSMGFECGSEKARLEVLKKRITNEQLRNACSLLKKYNIEIMGQWMYGLPDETFQEALETLILSVKSGDFPQLHMTTPLPGTKLFDIALEKGFITPDYVTPGLYEPSVFHDKESYIGILLISILHVLKDVRIPSNYHYVRYLGDVDFRGKTLGEIVVQEIENVQGSKLRDEVESKNIQ